MTERLWAPWRLAYVKSSDEADDGCFLCRYVAAAESEDPSHLVVARGQQTVTVLNRFPYNNGHLLIAPQAHKAELGELTDSEHLELMHEVTRITELLRSKMQPHGFNVGLNLGRVAGAGLPGHLHWHVVPRWNGDTNFMPVLGDTKVIPQALEALYELITNGRPPDDASA